MSRLFFILLLACGWMAGGNEARAQMAAVSSNALVLQAIRTMPSLGGYSANHQASVNLGGAVGLAGPAGLQIDAERACPSYCSGATYLVFLKTVNALVARGDLTPDPRLFAALLINGQRDGEGVWGRWNANGPGTARLFAELGCGTNFMDFSRAEAGDFMKVFWNDSIGRREHGHSVIFLEEGNLNGVPSVHFWSSNVGMGYGDKWVARARIKLAIFSRFNRPSALRNAPSLAPQVDPYLASLLTKDSSLAEVRQKCGM